MRVLRTESGAEYTIFGNRVKRLSGGDDKRADGAWLYLDNVNEFSQSETLVGRRLILQIEQLSSLGPDDEGNGQDSFEGGYTTRITTPVMYDSWWSEDPET